MKVSRHLLDLSWLAYSGFPAAATISSSRAAATLSLQWTGSASIVFASTPWSLKPSFSLSRQLRQHANVAPHLYQAGLHAAGCLAGGFSSVPADPSRPGRSYPADAGRGSGGHRHCSGPSRIWAGRAAGATVCELLARAVARGYGSFATVQPERGPHCRTGLSLDVAARSGGPGCGALPRHSSRGAIGNPAQPLGRPAAEFRLAPWIVVSELCPRTHPDSVFRDPAWLASCVGLRVAGAFDSAGDYHGWRPGGHTH